MKLWASRFEQDISQATLDYTQTTDIDEKMLREDIIGSVAHVIMLCNTEIIPASDGRTILKILLQLLDRAELGNVTLKKEYEDVHLNIETIVIKEIGLEAGGKMHTARSRNDQVVTDTRLYVRKQVLDLCEKIINFSNTLISLAENHSETLMLGYTHSQAAQPISYAFWLSSYASMFIRDVGRLLNSYSTVNQNPLGACALAGTSFPIDRQLTTTLLGFDQVLWHALDATSSRDFVLEVASALSISMSNVSKLCEEIVVWSSFEYGLIEVSDTFATGSSIMPQKKNPVVAELGRARAGVVFGSLMELLTVVKGISQGYSCDLQQDKPALWRAMDVTLFTFSILHSQMASIKYHADRAKTACWRSFSTATEIANYLVKQKEESFRIAYQITGEIIKELIEENKTLEDTEKLRELLLKRGIDVQSDQIAEIVDPLEVIKRQKSIGSTGPESVLVTLNKLKSELNKLEKIVVEKNEHINTSVARTLRIANDFILGQPLDVLINES